MPRLDLLVSLLYLVFNLLHALSFCFFFFFNDTATTEIYTLSLHDALPISRLVTSYLCQPLLHMSEYKMFLAQDRKSTRLNSSHLGISYAVFCLKKKKEKSAQAIEVLPERTRLRMLTTLRLCGPNAYECDSS